MKMKFFGDLTTKASMRPRRESDGYRYSRRRGSGDSFWEGTVEFQVTATADVVARNIDLPAFDRGLLIPSALARITYLVLLIEIVAYELGDTAVGNVAVDET